DSRPLADTLVFERRRGGLRAHRLPDWRRARMGDAGGGLFPDARDAAVLLERAAGHGPRRQHRIPRVLLSLPRSRERGAFRARRALDHGYRAAAGRGALLSILLRPERPS